MDSVPPPSQSPAPPQASALAASGASNASLRWRILRRALLAGSASSSRASGNARTPTGTGRKSAGILSPNSATHRSFEETSIVQQDKNDDTTKISRKTSRGFDLIECHVLPISQLTKPHGDSSSRYDNIVGCHNDVYVCYKLPCEGSPKLNLVYRREDSLELNDIVASNRYNIDTTGLVCCWPSEEVLAYYCINHPDLFRSKKVLELGAGYGLAGLVIAASTDADEVVISDGNPQVVGCILLSFTHIGFSGRHYSSMVFVSH
uniref:Calmodulin-lysine N-methyltransferase n=1 Tax=Leersia perrieri TaxID=77586 RepID=A0A0D9VRT4_9ORYZ